MKILIDDVLKKQGKNRHWLSEETGITYTNICNLCNGKTTSIQFDKIDKICSALNCSVSDILSHTQLPISRLLTYRKKIEEILQQQKGDTSD